MAANDSPVSSALTVRPARVEDAAQMARVNVRCWQETYRGLMPDAVLDGPGFLVARERFWTAALTDERYRENRVAVAERDGEMVGIAYLKLRQPNRAGPLFAQIGRDESVPPSIRTRAVQMAGSLGVNAIEEPAAPASAASAPAAPTAPVPSAAPANQAATRE